MIRYKVEKAENDKRIADLELRIGSLRNVVWDITIINAYIYRWIKRYKTKMICLRKWKNLFMRLMKTVIHKWKRNFNTGNLKNK